ncbi:(2Fe-2S)-binding protein [Derxia gummosa]|uniref:Bacterioferritin-associated ferredoxin n=1 Tax=Derxia gummosa DSM 723 TaxID=1121388 RepID=A0A8B6X8B1_9BURK|nr:(2Fe-2S)-binding protein [Derxia gummosa]
MIVCVCHNVSERKLRKCIHDGASCVRDLREASGLGGTCGKCVPEARAMLREAEAASTAATGFGGLGMGLAAA